LPEEEKEHLEIIITEYSEDKENFEEDIQIAIESWEEVDSIQRELLFLKQGFYKSLVPFIQENKLTTFTAYVESDITLREKSYEVATQIEQKHVERSERVDELQNQIKVHKENLHEQIRQKVGSRVMLRLDDFVSQEKFISLPNSTKISVFQRLIDRVKKKHESLKTAIGGVPLSEETILLYEIVEELLLSYITKWEQ